jgi:methylated-DNA-protein-cysteine methyltransferase related protein
MTSDAPFTTRVVAVVRRIPYGRVAAYGDVAALLGAPRAARGVGHALSSLPHGSDVPWWRVVNARGEISLKGLAGRIQRTLLEQEGVRFSGGRIDFRVHRWTPDSTRRRGGPRKARSPGGGGSRPPEE